MTDRVRRDHARVRHHQRVGWNAHVSKEFLLRWRAGAIFGEEEATAKPKQTKGSEYEAELCRRLIRQIDQELQRRETS